MTLSTGRTGVIGVQIAKSRIAVKLWPDVRSQRMALHCTLTNAHVKLEMQLRTVEPIEGRTQ